MHPRPSGVVSLLTDFGSRDPYVGVMRGVVLRHHRRAVLVDLCHEVPPFDVAVGAFFWRAAIGYFPDGTVHVGVVDPGVGTARAVLAASAHGCYWLAPDNGLLEQVLAAAPDAELRLVEPLALGLHASSRTFHGRDLFAPIAGWLSGGRYGFSALGQRVDRAGLVRCAADVSQGPRVVHVDGFGNLITSVPADAARGVAAVVVGATAVPVRSTYGDVAAGELVALVGSHGLLEIARNQGSAAAELGVGRGAAVGLRGGEESGS